MANGRADKWELRVIYYVNIRTDGDFPSIILTSNLSITVSPLDYKLK
jgi:hypothetical protein